MMDNLAPLAAAVVIVLAGLALLAALVVVAVRALRRRDAEAADKQLAELARLQAETAVRIEGMRDMLAGRQAELAPRGQRAARFGVAPPQPVHDHDAGSTPSRACKSSTSGWW